LSSLQKIAELMGKSRILVENTNHKGPRKDYERGFDGTGKYHTRYMDDVKYRDLTHGVS